MTALWILCGVLLFLALILFTPIGVELLYDGEITVSVRALCFRYRVMPKKQKKINLRKFSKKRYEKMLAKEKKKAEKKAAKKAKKAASEKEDEQAEVKEGEKGDKSKLVSDLWSMRSLIVRTIRSFIGRIRTERMRVRLLIGSDNAAKSALIYGAASNVAVDLQEILRTQTDLRQECEIAIGVDFTSEKTIAEAEIRLAVTVAGVIATAFGFIVGFLKQKIRQDKKA